MVRVHSICVSSFSFVITASLPEFDARCKLNMGHKQLECIERREKQALFRTIQLRNAAQKVERVLTEPADVLLLTSSRNRTVIPAGTMWAKKVCV